MSHFLSTSDSFDPVTKRYCWPEGINATGRRMLFTGPDGVTDQRVAVAKENRYIGIGTMSPEGTSELSYLYRPNWNNAPRLLRKNRRVGEIGWGIPEHSDFSLLLSRQQITRGEFRTAAEDRHTHLYQNPWTPFPSPRRRRPHTSPRLGNNYTSDSKLFNDEEGTMGHDGQTIEEENYDAMSKSGGSSRGSSAPNSAR